MLYEGTEAPTAKVPLKVCSFDHSLKVGTVQSSKVNKVTSFRLVMILCSCTYRWRDELYVALVRLDIAWINTVPPTKVQHQMSFKFSRDPEMRNYGQAPSAWNEKLNICGTEHTVVPDALVKIPIFVSSQAYLHTSFLATIVAKSRRHCVICLAIETYFSTWRAADVAARFLKGENACFWPPFERCDADLSTVAWCRALSIRIFGDDSY